MSTLESEKQAIADLMSHGRVYCVDGYWRGNVYTAWIGPGGIMSPHWGSVIFLDDEATLFDVFSEYEPGTPLHMKATQKTFAEAIAIIAEGAVR